MPVSGVDVEQVGDSESRPFCDRKIPVLDIHSVTQDTLKIFHSPADRLEAIQVEHNLETYKLVAAILVYMDAHFDRSGRAHVAR